MALDTDLLLEHGINTDIGQIRLFGAVDQAMFERLANGVAILIANEKQKIVLSINTTGGDEHIALAMFDYIRINRKNLGTGFIGRVNGECNSAGTLILQACNERWMTANSRMLFHFGSGEYEGAHDIKELIRIDRLWNALIAERTGQPLGRVIKWHRSETYFDAKQCLKLNLVDEVL